MADILKELTKENDNELKECCGAYCSDAGCCPFPKRKKNNSGKRNPLEPIIEEDEVKE